MTNDSVIARHFNLYSHWRALTFQHWGLCLSDVLILMHCMIYFSKLQPSQRTYQSSQTEIDIHDHAKLCVQASGRQCADGQHREFRDTSGRRRRRLCIALHSHSETRSFNQSAHCYVYILFTVTCRRLVPRKKHDET